MAFRQSPRWQAARGERASELSGDALACPVAQVAAGQCFQQLQVRPEPLVQLEAEEIHLADRPTVLEVDPPQEALDGRYFAVRRLQGSLERVHCVPVGPAMIGAGPAHRERSAVEGGVALAELRYEGGEARCLVQRAQIVC